MVSKVFSRSGTREYALLGRLKAPRGTAAYIVSDGKEPYLLLKMQPAPAVREMERYFASSAVSGFSDLIDTYREDDVYCLVFQYLSLTDGVHIISFADKGDIALRNKLAMNLINACFGVPWPVLYDVLKPNKVYSDYSGNVSFLYTLSPQSGYGRDCRGEVMSSLANMLRRIYKNMDYPLLNVFLASLEKTEYATLLEVKTAFMKVYSAIESMPVPSKTQVVKEVKLIEKALAVKDKAQSKMPVIMAVLLLMVGYFFLGRELYNTLGNKERPGQLERIGTVQIDERDNDNQ